MGRVSLFGRARANSFEEEEREKTEVFPPFLACSEEKRESLSRSSPSLFFSFFFLTTGRRHRDAATCFSSDSSGRDSCSHARPPWPARGGETSCGREGREEEEELQGRGRTKDQGKLCVRGRGGTTRFVPANEGVFLAVGSMAWLRGIDERIRREEGGGAQTERKTDGEKGRGRHGRAPLLLLPRRRPRPPRLATFLPVSLSVRPATPTRRRDTPNEGDAIKRMPFVCTWIERAKGHSHVFFVLGYFYPSSLGSAPPCGARARSLPPSRVLTRPVDRMKKLVLCPVPGFCV